MIRLVEQFVAANDRDPTQHIVIQCLVRSRRAATFDNPHATIDEIPELRTLRGAPVNLLADGRYRVVTTNETYTRLEPAA